MKSYSIKFPITDDTVLNNFFKMNYLTKDAYSSSLLLLLLTEKGERYYDPEYGTNLLYYLFENDKNLVQNDIVNDIKQSVSRYIPNMQIENIVFNYNNNDNDDNQVNIYIQFSYTEENFTETGTLTINI